jgi:hypothetical protein
LDEAVVAVVLLPIAVEIPNVHHEPVGLVLDHRKGFTLYMAKALISGRGDEIIDLARTNLWR